MAQVAYTPSERNRGRAGITMEPLGGNCVKQPPGTIKLLAPLKLHECGLPTAILVIRKGVRFAARRNAAHDQENHPDFSHVQVGAKGVLENSARAQRK